MPTLLSDDMAALARPRTIRLIIQRDGWRALYRGYLPELLASMLQKAVQFGYVSVSSHLDRFEDLFESAIATIKRRPYRVRKPSPVPDSVDRRLSVAISEIVAYPLRALASRMMVYEGPQSVSLGQMLELTLRYDGVAALFRGLEISLPISLLKSEMASRVGNSIMCSDEDALDFQSCALLYAVSSSLLLAPLERASVLRRCQSRIMGLCEHKSLPCTIREFAGPSAPTMCLGGVLLMLAMYNSWTKAERRDESSSDSVISYDLPSDEL